MSSPQHLPILDGVESREGSGLPRGPKGLRKKRPVKPRYVPQDWMTDSTFTALLPSCALADVASRSQNSPLVEPKLGLCLFSQLNFPGSLFWFLRNEVGAATCLPSLPEWWLEADLS